MLVLAAWTHRFITKPLLRPKSCLILPRQLAIISVYWTLAVDFLVTQTRIFMRYVYHMDVDFWLCSKVAIKCISLFWIYSQIATIVNSSIALHFPPCDGVRIIAEPGRFYVSSAYTLACRVHSKRENSHNGIIENVMYFINDGVYGSFNCNLYDHKIVHPKTLKNSMCNEPLYKSSIWGPTCDALDQVKKTSAIVAQNRINSRKLIFISFFTSQVCENVLLPHLNIDDIIVFENMGAYTIPIASPFNGFPLPKIEYYIERKHL